MWDSAERHIVAPSERADAAREETGMAVLDDIQVPVLESGCNAYLSEFLRNLETIWDDPEVTPLPTLRTLPYIFEQIAKMDAEDAPRPAICPDEGELLVVWRDENRSLILRIDVASLQSTLSRVDYPYQNLDSSETVLNSSDNWQAVKKELTDGI